MTNANVLTFLQELFQRLATKSPKFFKIWTWISGALVLITGIPDFISMLPVGIVIPDLFNEGITIAVRYAGTGILLMSLLTTQSKPGAITDGGVVIKSTDAAKLPFTAAAEQKVAEKQNIATVKLEVIPKAKNPNFDGLSNMKPAAPEDQELQNKKK